jgi:hypothetical protein
VASPWPTPLVVRPPWSTLDATPSPIKTPRREKPNDLINFPETHREPPPSSTRDREGPEALADVEKCYFDIPPADVAKKKPLGRINDVLIMVYNNLVPVDFLVMDVECNASCPIILGRPFLRTVGAIIDMKEGTVKCHFPLKKGMEHFPMKRKKLLFESILRENYELDALSLDIT